MCTFLANNDAIIFCAECQTYEKKQCCQDCGYCKGKLSGTAGVAKGYLD